MNIEFKRIRLEDKQLLQQFFNVYEITKLYPYYLNSEYCELNSNGAYKYAIIDIDDGDKVLLCIKDIKLFTTKYLRILGIPISLNKNHNNELIVFNYAKDVLKCKNILLKEDEVCLLPEYYHNKGKYEDFDYYTIIEERKKEISKSKYRSVHRINKFKEDTIFRIANLDDIDQIKNLHEGWKRYKLKNKIPIRSKKIFKNMFKNIEKYMDKNNNTRLYVLYYKNVLLGFNLLTDMGNNNVHQIVQQTWNRLNPPNIIIEDNLHDCILWKDVMQIMSNIGQQFYFYIINQLSNEGYKLTTVAGTGGNKSLLTYKQNLNKHVIKYKLIELES